MHDHQISHGDLRGKEITVDDGTARFGGFGNAEYGATDEQLQADIAQLLMTTLGVYGAPAAVGAAVDVFGKDAVLMASRRLTKSAMPSRIRKSVADAGAVLSAARDEVKRQTGADKIQAETITRFTRYQVIQLVLLVALVYVAYPFISTVPDVLLRTENGELLVGVARTCGVGVDVRRRGSRTVGLRGRHGELQESDDHAGGQHVCRDHDSGRRRRTCAVHPVPAEGRAGALRATAAVALQQAVQVITHVALLIFFTSPRALRPTCPTSSPRPLCCT